MGPTPKSRAIQLVELCMCGGAPHIKTEKLGALGAEPVRPPTGGANGRHAPPRAYGLQPNKCTQGIRSPSPKVAAETTLFWGSAHKNTPVNLCF